MFLTLLVVTFLIALLVTFIVASVFQKSVSDILDRLLVRELSTAWQRYMSFAIYVVGILAAYESGTREVHKPAGQGPTGTAP